MSIRQFLEKITQFRVLIITVCVFPSIGFSAESDDWRFIIAPYAWLSGQNGQVGTFPGYPTADIDIDFYDDVLGNINGAMMIVGQAMKGDFGISADVVYTDIEMGGQTPGNYFNTLTSHTKSWIFSTLAAISDEPLTDRRFWLQ